VSLLALVAARPITFPPIVLFGPAKEMVGPVGFVPNSRVVVEPADTVAVLGEVVRYWVTINTPLT